MYTLYWFIDLSAFTLPPVVIFPFAAKVPEKWRALLLDALASAQASVGETKEKSSSGASKGGGGGGGKGSSESVKASGRHRTGSAAAMSFAGAPIATNLYLDGLQPFVQYRRLLSLALLVRSLTDNPLLPTELFASPHRHYTGNIDIR